MFCLLGKSVLIPNAVYMFMVYDLKIERPVRNTVWGFSKLEVLHERLLDAVAAIVLRKLPAVNGQSMANTVSLPA